MLEQVLEGIKKRDAGHIKIWSGRLIHSAAIYQRPEPIRIAVICYALSKIFERTSKKKRKWKKYWKDVRNSIIESLNALNKHDFIKFDKEFRILTNLIATADPDFNDHLRFVLTKAKIKEAFRLFDHGLSLGRVAELLCVSRWELADFVGSDRSEYQNFITRTVAERYNRLITDFRRFPTYIDSSSLISLSLNCLQNLFGTIKEKFSNVDFIIGKSVVHESVDNAIRNPRYRLNGYRIQEMISNGVIRVEMGEEIKEKTSELLKAANKIYIARNTPIPIIHAGETECIAIPLIEKRHSFVNLLIDERTTRLLLENPRNLQSHLTNKLHEPVRIDERKLKQFQALISGLEFNIFRSTELVTLGVQYNLFKKFLNCSDIVPTSHNIPTDDNQVLLLEGMLWGLRMQGCSILEEEINGLIAIISN